MIGNSTQASKNDSEKRITTYTFQCYGQNKSPLAPMWDRQNVRISRLASRGINDGQMSGQITNI